MYAEAFADQLRDHMPELAPRATVERMRDRSLAGWLRVDDSALAGDAFSHRMTVDEASPLPAKG